MTPQEHISPEEVMTAPLFAAEQLGKQLGNTLILAPHPDDEVLGCGGLIQFLLEQNVNLAVCFVTSGNASHPNSKKFPSDTLGQLREKEARDSCQILGIETKNIIFLKHPDALLSSFNQEKKNQLATEIAKILREYQISSLALPWRRDPHPDHRASFEVGKMAIELVDGSIQLVEYPIWLWKNSSTKDWPLKDEMEIYRLDISRMMLKKNEAIYAHKSQTSQLIDDDPQGFILTDDLLDPFLRPFEFYFFNKKEQRSCLRKEYFDSLYSHNPDPWNFRNSAYEKQKYKTIDTYLRNRSYKKALELGCSIGVHTAHLAEHCENLLAVDINEAAIATAKETISLSHVQFKKMDVMKKFPKGPFDFISMCEMGYYLNQNALCKLFQDISKNLHEDGEFLMVHWTSYVREYPLNGRHVHQLFADYQIKEKEFSLISSVTEDRYELVLWKKKKQPEQKLKFP